MEKIIRQQSYIVIQQDLDKQKLINKMFSFILDNFQNPLTFYRWKKYLLQSRALNLLTLELVFQARPHYSRIHHQRLIK